MMLGQVTLTVTRPGVETVVDGSPVAGAGSDFQVTGSLQPMGREAQYLPEGIREKAQYRLYLAVGQPTLRSVDIGSYRGGDQILHEGRYYQVWQDRDYSLHATGRPHHRYILLLVTAR